MLSFELFGQKSMLLGDIFQQDLQKFDCFGRLH